MAASFHNMIQGLLAGLFAATKHHAGAAYAGNRSSRRVQSRSSSGGSTVLPVR